MIRPILWLTLFACSLAPAAHAENFVIELDAEVARARYVFEGELADPVPGRDAVRIAVDPDPTRIFRGFEAAGTTIEVALPEHGPEDFRNRVAAGRPYLFVVGPDGSIVTAATPSPGGWILMGFCDLANGVVFRIATPEPTVESSPEISEAWLTRATGRDVRRDPLRLGRVLLATRTGPERFETAIRDLRSEDWEVRSRAQEALSGPSGLEFRDRVETLAGGETDVEIAHRLEEIGAELGRWALVEEAARPLSAPGHRRWRVLVRCLLADDEELVRSAHDALVSETGRDLPRDPAAWEKVLEAR